MADIDAIQARADAAMDARDTALYAISYGIGVTEHHWQRADASARDVPALLTRVRELEAAVGRVAELHKVAPQRLHGTDDCPDEDRCELCGEPWPCDTFTALRGSDV